MNAYYEVLNVLKTSLENNIDVNTVLTDDTSKGVDVNKMNIYNLAFIDVRTGLFKSNVSSFFVSIQCLGVPNHSKEPVTDKFLGNDNSIDIYNTTIAVLRRTFDEIVKDVYTKDITIIGDGDFEKVENKKNGAIGWELNFEIETPNTVVTSC